MADETSLSEDQLDKIKKLLAARGAIKLLKEDRTAVQVCDGLFLGSYGAAQHKAHLVKLGISHVLCAAGSVEMHFPELFNYKNLQILDVPTENLTRHFEDCFQFINTALARGGRVLVHCWRGNSRSATIVIAWLMRHKGMTFRTAVEHCQDLRPSVEPNSGFMVQLQQYEKDIAKFAATADAA